MNILSFLRIPGDAPATADDEQSVRLERRVFHIVMLVSAVSYPLYSLIFLTQGLGAAAAICAACGGSVAVAAWLGYRRRRFTAGLHCWAAGLLAILSTIMYREGGVSAPAAPWLCVVPYVFIVSGRFRAACGWLVVVTAVLAGYYVLGRQGHAFARELGDDPGLTHARSAFFLGASVIAFAVMVEQSRRRLVGSLREQNALLAAARDRALAASAAKARFLATMSHEIRTPLNGVLGAADVLGATPLNSEQSQLVELMRHSGKSLLGLIDDVLDYSKIESGRLMLERIPFDPREVVEQVAELWSPVAAEKGLEIVCRVALDVPVLVEGDPLRLRQILTNLAGNAIKFTAAGRVTLDVRRVNGTHRGPLPLVITVSDTGIGMSREALAALLQAFAQADAPIAPIHGGSGLGLVIAKALTEMLGGRIAVASRLGEGSRFTCEIPFPVLRDADVRGHQPLLVGTMVALLEPRSATRAVIEEYLMAEGARVIAFEDPAALRGFIDVPPQVRVAALVSAEAVAREDGPDRAWLDLPEATRARITLLARPGEAGEAVRRLPPGTPILYKPVKHAALMAAMTRAAANPGQQPPAEAPLPAGVRVLIADDSPMNRRLAGMMLQRLGCAVEMVEDGDAAIRAWRAGLHDLILMDCQMPVCDGLTATREIRRQERAQGRPRVPIVALTANTFAEDRAECLAAGMDDFLAKPIGQDVLRAKVAAWTTAEGSLRASA